MDDLSDSDYQTVNPLYRIYRNQTFKNVKDVMLEGGAGYSYVSWPWCFRNDESVSLLVSIYSGSVGSMAHHPLDRPRLPENDSPCQDEATEPVGLREMSEQRASGCRI